MSWIDFANHFLSNQRLHAWSWINRTFLGNGFFWWEIWLWVFLGLFLFCFCLARGEKVASAQDFVSNQRERTTLGCGFLFLVHLVTILYWLDIVWPKDLSGCFFSFLPILDREFSLLSFFLLSPTLSLGIFFLFCVFCLSWIGNFLLFVSSPFLELGIFLLFVFSFEGKDWHSHPGSRFMVSWDFGSRLIERMVMIYVRVWPVVRG